MNKLEVHLTTNDLSAVSTIKMENSKDIKEYILGEFPPEQLYEAADYELRTGIRPKLTQKEYNTLNTIMEQYVLILLIQALKLYGRNGMERAPDGCPADLLYRNSLNDTLYLGIQIKSTGQAYKDKTTDRILWKFSAVNKKHYHGLLMFFRCITDGKSWLIPYDRLQQDHNGYVIGIGKSGKNYKFMKDFEVTDQTFASKIIDYYTMCNSSKQTDLSNCLILHPKEKLIIPVSQSTRIEMAVRERLRPILEKTQLKISPPPIEGLSYDQIIGDLLIQEKLALTTESGSLQIRLRQYDAGKRLPYKTTSFHILIIHLPEPFERFFYFIPMDKLIDHDYIKTDKVIGKTSIMLYPHTLRLSHVVNRDEWCNEFLLHYDDPSIAIKLLAIYRKQLLHDPNPIQVQIERPWIANKCDSLTMLLFRFNLTRVYPDTVCTYSYKLNGKRILEKYAYISKKKNVPTSFRINTYHLNGTTTIFPTKNEFDYMFVHLSEKYQTYFILVPVSRLFERYAQKSEKDKLRHDFRIILPKSDDQQLETNNKWLTDFLFSYEDLDVINKINNLFNTNWH